jgi:hypothetical protein
VSVALAVAGTIVVLLVIVLATPFDVALTAVKVDGVPLSVRADIWWLGKKVAATGRHATPSHPSDARPASARSPDRSRFRSLVRTRGFWQRVARLLLQELRLTVPRRLFLRARVGFDSPADTGALLGWLYALRGRWASSTCLVSVEPDFTREVCEGELRLLWSLRPIVVVLPLMTFGIWILFHARTRRA